LGEAGGRDDGKLFLDDGLIGLSLPLEAQLLPAVKDLLDGKRLRISSECGLVLDAVCVLVKDYLSTVG
jgi:hypothetical protein